jgi:hypothetical protein
LRVPRYTGRPAPPRGHTSPKQAPHIPLDGEEELGWQRVVVDKKCYLKAKKEKKTMLVIKRNK